MQLSERRAWNKTTTTKTNNNKSWKRLQVLIAARSLNKTFLLYVLQSCYTTAKTCVTTYNKCLCLHNILYWIQYSKSKIAENKQAILRMNCRMSPYDQISIFFETKLNVWAFEILEASKYSNACFYDLLKISRLLLSLKSF